MKNTKTENKSWNIISGMSQYFGDILGIIKTEKKTENLIWSAVNQLLPEPAL